jgi:mRNA interferase MazF
MVTRGDIWLVALVPTVGSVIQKTRPCIVVSPDQINSTGRTFLIAPMTTGSRAAPFRPPVSFQGKTGFILADQIRTVDRKRLVKRLGQVDTTDLKKLLATLREMFAP